MSVEENKELIRRMVEEIWNEHNLDNISEFIGGDLLEEARDHDQQFLTAFPDVHLTIKDLIGEGDKVVARLAARAKNTGPFAGQPATGKEVEIHSIRIYRIFEKKIVESWAMQDRLGLMEQLGFVQAVGEVNWADGEGE